MVSVTLAVAPTSSISHVLLEAASSILLFQLAWFRDSLARRGWARNVFRRPRRAINHG